MHRKLNERYPFLMFVTDDGGDTGGGAEPAEAPAPDPDGKKALTIDGSDADVAFKARLERERAKWEKEVEADRADAAKFREQVEAQKSEAQKAIERAEAAERHLALVKAGIPEDEWSDYDDFTGQQIEKLAAKLAPKQAPQEDPKPDPADGRPRLNLRGGGDPDIQVRTREDLKKVIDSIPRR